MVATTANPSMPIRELAIPSGTRAETGVRWYQKM